MATINKVDRMQDLLLSTDNSGDKNGILTYDEFIKGAVGGANQHHAAGLDEAAVKAELQAAWDAFREALGVQGKEIDLKTLDADNNLVNGLTFDDEYKEALGTFHDAVLAAFGTKGNDALAYYDTRTVVAVGEKIPGAQPDIQPPGGNPANAS